MKTVSQAISYLFHPLLFATYLVLILGWFIPHFLLIPSSSILLFAGFVFALTFLLPVANLIMFKAFGTLPSLHMRNRQERLIPFTLISIIYIVITVLFFYKVRGNINFNKVMMIVSAMVVVSTVVTFFFKISIHSLAACGALGVLMPLNKVVGDGALLWPTLALLVIAGAVMSARLYLNAHTPREVLYGALAGYGIGFFGMVYLF